MGNPDRELTCKDCKYCKPSRQPNMVMYCGYSYEMFMHSNNFDKCGSYYEPKETEMSGVIKSGEELRQHGILKFRDRVEIAGIVYKLQHSFLTNVEGHNAEIFTKLKLNKMVFCTNAYGYTAVKADCPTCEFGDYTALTRLVAALYVEAEKQVKSTAKPQWRARVKSVGNNFHGSDLFDPPLRVGDEVDVVRRKRYNSFYIDYKSKEKICCIKCSSRLGGGNWELFQVGGEVKSEIETTDVKDIEMETSCHTCGYGVEQTGGVFCNKCNSLYRSDFTACGNYMPKTSIETKDIKMNKYPEEYDYRGERIYLMNCNTWTAVGDWTFRDTNEEIEAIIDKRKDKVSDMMGIECKYRLNDNSVLIDYHGIETNQPAYIQHINGNFRCKGENQMSDTKQRWSKTRKLGKLYRLAAVMYLTKALVPAAIKAGTSVTPAVMWLTKHAVLHLTPWDAMEWSGETCWAVTGAAAGAVVVTGIIGKIILKKTEKSFWSIA